MPTQSRFSVGMGLLPRQDDVYGCRLGAGLFFKFRMPDAPR